MARLSRTGRRGGHVNAAISLKTIVPTPKILHSHPIHHAFTFRGLLDIMLDSFNELKNRRRGIYSRGILRSGYLVGKEGDVLSCFLLRAILRESMAQRRR